MISLHFAAARGALRHAERAKSLESCIHFQMFQYGAKPWTAFWPFCASGCLTTDNENICV
jgi:hypothetical protein